MNEDYKLVFDSEDIYETSCPPASDWVMRQGKTLRQRRPIGTRRVRQAPPRYDGSLLLSKQAAWPTTNYLS